MRKLYVSALVPVALILQLSSAGAAPDRELRARWAEAVEPQASKIVIHNLGTRPAEASLGSKAVAISAEGTAEIPAGPGQLRSDAALLVLQAPEGFDPASLEVDKVVSEGPRRAQSKARDSHPAWARDLVAGVAHIRHGVTGAADIKSEDPAARVEVAVEFLAPHTLVRVRQLDAMGNEVTSLMASASRPVRWRATLEPVAGESRIELQTLRGEAQGTAAAIQKSTAASKRTPIDPPVTGFTGGGLAKFIPTINWQGSGNLVFEVSGGPANLCGDLYISRNYGAWTVSPGWICLNGSGYAQKGPWTYAGQSGDEDASAYVIWSDLSSTNTANHIWDKTGPSVTMTPNGGVPAPTSVSGTANDGSYGSGFSAGFPAAAGGGSSSCVMYFYDKTAGGYWCPGDTSYPNYFPCNPSCTLSGMPSRSITWSKTSGLPPGLAHTSGHCYEWGVVIMDNSTYGKEGRATHTFCVP
jgi:hypothetical protein